MTVRKLQGAQIFVLSSIPLCAEIGTYHLLCSLKEWHYLKLNIFLFTSKIFSHIMDIKKNNRKNAMFQLKILYITSDVLRILCIQIWNGMSKLI
jgi:hypothetical protein